MDTKGHYTLLVYPFRHSVPDQQRTKTLKSSNPRWHPWWIRFDRDGLKQCLDDSYFFLPYVRQLLYPETALLPANDTPHLIKEADRLARLPVHELAEKISPEGVLRLTYSPEQLEALGPLQLESERSQYKEPLRLCWVDVALFPQNVGFLTIKVQLQKESASVDQLNDLLYQLRLVHAPTLDWDLPKWRRAKEEHPLVFKSRDLLDFLLQGLAEASDGSEPSVIDASLEAFLGRMQKHPSAPRYSTTQAGQIYGQSFREFSYACLNEDVPAAAAAADAGGPGVFNSTSERALYELSTCTRTGHPDYEPHPSRVKQLMADGHIALWRNWEAMALHDNVVFLGTRRTRLTETVLAHNVESDYFQLYLVAYYTKMRLSMFSGELMRHGAQLHQNLRDARALWDSFTMFRNHYWFSEITFKTQGMDIFRKFQDGLNVVSLFDSVSREVRELQEYYEHKAELERNDSMNQLQTAMNDNLAVVAEVQKNVHFIELFIVAVYSAHLYHMATSGAEQHEGPWWHRVHWGVILWAVAGLVAVVVIQKIVESRHKAKHGAGQPAGTGTGVRKLHGPPPGHP